MTLPTGLNNTQFEITFKSDGIYIVKLATKDKIEVGKKIIIKNEIFYYI